MNEKLLREFSYVFNVDEEIVFALYEHLNSEFSDFVLIDSTFTKEDIEMAAIVEMFCNLKTYNLNFRSYGTKNDLRNHVRIFNEFSNRNHQKFFVEPRLFSLKPSPESARDLILRFTDNVNKTIDNEIKIITPPCNYLNDKTSPRCDDTLVDHPILPGSDEPKRCGMCCESCGNQRKRD